MTPLRAVVFDAVGTLITPDPAAADVYYRVGRRHGSLRERDDVAARFVDAFRAACGSDGDDPYRTDETREFEFWRRVVATVFEELPSEPLEACFHDLFEHFARPSAWRVYPNVPETLALLRNRGLRTAIASNFDARLHTVRAGLRGLDGLDRCFVSSEIGWKKPDRRFFAAVCDMLDCRPAEILYVGDEPESDVAAARAAGLRAVLIRQDGPAAKPLAVVQDLVSGQSPR